MSGFTTPVPVGQSALDAVAAAIPKPATVPPTSEAVVPNAGTDPTKFAMQGHAHERLTSAHNVTTDASGKVTITFTRKFAQMPCPIISGIAVPGVSASIVWVMTGTDYTGATLTCTRRTASSAVTTVTVAGIPVVNGVTTSTNDAPAANTQISAVFLQVSG